MTLFQILPVLLTWPRYLKHNVSSHIIQEETINPIHHSYSSHHKLVSSPPRVSVQLLGEAKSCSHHHHCASCVGLGKLEGAVQNRNLVSRNSSTYSHTKHYNRYKTMQQRFLITSGSQSYFHIYHECPGFIRNVKLL